MPVRMPCLMAAIVITGASAIAMASDAPWLLYPSTQSLPPGLYIRTWDPPAVDAIVAFRVPEAAVQYKVSVGERVDESFLFMKPVVAGPGDYVCHRWPHGLELNGQPIANVTAQDRLGRPLPIWRGCETLGSNRYFTLSNHVPNSFDSRHFGPIDAADILGVYRPLVTLITSTSIAIYQSGGQADDP